MLCSGLSSACCSFVCVQHNLRIYWVYFYHANHVFVDVWNGLCEVKIFTLFCATVRSLCTAVVLYWHVLKKWKHAIAFLKEEKMMNLKPVLLSINFSLKILRMDTFMLGISWLHQTWFNSLISSKRTKFRKKTSIRNKCSIGYFIISLCRLNAQWFLKFWNWEWNHKYHNGWIFKEKNKHYKFAQRVDIRNINPKFTL